MKKLFVTALIAAFTYSGATAADGNKGKRVSENKMGAYLMVYHKDADHGLHMAVSYDGYKWSALNNDKAVIAGDTIAEQHGIRDPHIFRGPDGGFYLAMTDLHVFGKRDGIRDTEWERDGKKYGWGNNRGLVLMKSFDLINWTRTNLDFTYLGGKWNDVGCVWAPEVCYDDKAKKIMVHFTVRFGAGKESIYYIYTNDEFTRMDSKPVEMFSAPDHKYSVIDSDIIKFGGKYHMFYVSHESTATPVHATAKKITGPYVIDTLYHDGEKRGHEAPNCWKRIGEKKYVVMFDNYRTNPHNFGFVETADFKTFTPIGYFDGKDSPMTRTNFSAQKHGAVIWLTKDEALALEQHWNK